MSIPDYNILYDNGKTICFVGDTYPNHVIFNSLKDQRPCELIRYEGLAGKTQEWYDERQFFCTSSTLPFKQKIIATLNQFNVSYVSFIEKSTVVSSNVSIGYNTCIQSHCSLYDGVSIGNHCHLVTYITVVHESIIENFCYICPYAYICFTTLGEGVVVGLRSSFVPVPPERFVIPEYTNFLMNSSITKPVTVTGTYYGNRRTSDETSLTYKIF